MTYAELDAAVARVVMGWRRVKGCLWYDSHGGCPAYDFHPAINPFHCFRVLDRMLRRGMDVSLYLTAARVRPSPELRSIYIKPAATTMRAICEASVLATIEWRKARRAGK
jgi:hypothetical protein